MKYNVFLIYNYIEIRKIYLKMGLPLNGMFSQTSAVYTNAVSQLNALFKVMLFNITQSGVW